MRVPVTSSVGVGDRSDCLATQAPATAASTSAIRMMLIREGDMCEIITQL